MNEPLLSSRSRSEVRARTAHRLPCSALLGFFNALGRADATAQLVTELEPVQIDQSEPRNEEEQTTQQQLLVPAPTPTSQVPRAGPHTSPPPRPELDRRYVARVIVRAALTSSAAVGGSAVVRLLQALLAAVILAKSSTETCDNADLLRIWLLVYAARCCALAHLLYSRHRLYARGATRRAGGVAQLYRARVRAEHLKARLDSLGTVWFVLGSLWLFGSVDCAAAAPTLTQLVLSYLLLGFVSLFVPIFFFGALCGCLPCILPLLSRHLAPAAGEPDAFAWISDLPCHEFVRAADEDEQASASEQGQAEECNDSDSVHSAGSSPGCGGWLGKRRIEAEDAQCVVCLGSYTHGTRVRQLPCTHHFDQPCIDTWLRVNASCPLCKAKVGPRANAEDGEEDEHTSREAYLAAAVRGGDDILAVLV